MAHIGILCPTISGHLNPMTALGYELKQRGHRVTVLGIADGKNKVLAAGLAYLSIGEEAFPEGATAKDLAQLGELSGIAALRYSLTLLKRATLVLLTDVPARLKSAGVELLLIDQVLYCGSTVADIAELPFITVCCALMLNQDANIPPFYTHWRYHPTWWARLRNRASEQLLAMIASSVTTVVAQHRQHHGLPPLKHQNEAYSQLAQICQQPAEFEFPRPSLPDHFHFTGPYINPASREPTSFPFEQLTGQPLIYASLGTLQNRLIEAFQIIAEACHGLDVQLVIALGGGSSPDALPALPGNPIVVGYAPQLALLKRATLTITHAGMNTALEALSNGVPMVAIPIANDQPAVAARIAWTGSGQVLLLKQLSVPKLRRAIHQVLTHETYRQNAIRLQKAIQTTGGVNQAADIVEQVLSTGKSALV